MRMPVMSEVMPRPMLWPAIMVMVVMMDLYSILIDFRHRRWQRSSAR
jgi:hypothetical protein